MKKIIDLILRPFRELIERRRMQKKIKAMRERDPFIYK